MKKLYLFLISVLCLSFQVKAGDVLTLTADNSTVTENFDGMWDAGTSTATLNMPDGWRIDRQMNAPRMVGAYNAAATEVMYTGGVSLASNAKNGTWNFGSSAAPSDRAVGGLSTTVDGGTRCVSIMTQLTNIAKATMKQALPYSCTILMMVAVGRRLATTSRRSLQRIMRPLVQRLFLSRQRQSAASS